MIGMENYGNTIFFGYKMCVVCPDTHPKIDDFSYLLSKCFPAKKDPPEFENCIITGELTSLQFAALHLLY